MIYPKHVLAAYQRRLAAWKAAMAEVKAGRLSLAEFQTRYPASWVYLPLIRWSQRNR